MTPNVDERLASIIRSLTQVVLPHLPPEASLAQEQTQLAIGQLQILRAQIDQVPDFEREELDDYLALARALLANVAGGSATQTAKKEVEAAIAGEKASDVRGQRKAVNEAVEKLVSAVSEDGDAGAASRLRAIIIEHEDKRAQKDRQWFAPYGFDQL